MSEQIAYTHVGKFQVSTVRTVAGGAEETPANMLQLRPCSDRDYADETPWPYETMVFKGGATGLYHAAYATRAEARRGHAEVVARLKRGEEVVGGVQGQWGVPSLTAAEWRARQ